MSIVQNVALWCFWISCGVVVYTYILYPVILFLVYAFVQVRRDVRFLLGRRDRRAGEPATTELPSVSLIVAAYNEETSLAEKLANIQALDYPRDRFEVVFVSDGSTDRTNSILQAAAETGEIRCVFLEQRGGKPRALNHAVAEARNDILVFSDASTLFAPNVVRMLARHFTSRDVGAVCGAVRLLGSAESHQTEGAYWKFESALHLMEGRLGATVTASGAIYALRRTCFKSLQPGDIIDDFLVPMQARQMGYRVLHDPEALATEFSADSVKGEFTRRVRLATGSFRALSRLRSPFLGSVAGWALFSHKILRWILPFLLIGVLVSNLFLLNHSLYRIIFLCQLAFYAWAGLGFLFRQRMQRVRYALIGYFLVAMHVAFLVGFWRYLWRQADSTWQRVN